ncbi:hypothetical protein MBANPS3_005384 [Mucor bainieri]
MLDAKIRALYMKQLDQCSNLVIEMMMIWVGLPIKIGELITFYWLDGGNLDAYLRDPLFQLVDEAENPNSKMRIMRYIIKFVGSVGNEQIWRDIGNEMNYVFIFVPSLLHVSYVEDGGAGPIRYWMTSGELGDYWKLPEELEELQRVIKKF